MYNFLTQEYIKEEEVKNLIPEIKKEFSNHKHVPTDLEIPFYIAISQFPELKDVYIDVKKKHFDLTLQAQPVPNFIFKKKVDRKYRINLNIDQKKSHGVIFENLPFDAQVGIMAHELCHIISYKEKSNLEMIIFAIRFLGIKFRRKIEKDTDREVIKRGFGWQMYEWADFAMYRSGSPRRHKYYKLGYYLSPEDVIEELRTYPKLYKSFNK